AICTATGAREPQLISDGAGGAIITWQDRRSGLFEADIYAQRVNESGVVQWTADGVAISTATGEQRWPQLISDDAGGAIITWTDNRSGFSESDIYAQRLNASGVVQWTADGVAISTTTGDQQNPQLISDGAGGAIITWQDQRSGNNDIYAQNVCASGIIGPCATTNITWTETPDIRAYVFNGQVTVVNTGEAAQAAIEVLDMNGRTVLNTALHVETGSTNRTSVETLPTGVYVLRVTMGKKAFVHKFVKH
nr:T9SS type A sorting domain-containing protein [Bacteroidota bacterium]